MDAITSRETQTQLRAFRGGRNASMGGKVAAARAEAPRDSVFAEVKRQAMDAIKNVQTVGQVGWMKVGAGVAVYAAHVRQRDEGNMREIQQQRDARPQRVERLERE